MPVIPAYTQQQGVCGAAFVQGHSTWCIYLCMCLGVLHLKPLCCCIYFACKPDCASLLPASPWALLVSLPAPRGTSFCCPSHSPLAALSLSWGTKYTSKRAVRSERASSAEISKSRPKLTSFEEFYFSIPLTSFLLTTVTTVDSCGLKAQLLFLICKR